MKTGEFAAIKKVARLHPDHRVRLAHPPNSGSSLTSL